MPPPQDNSTLVQLPFVGGLDEKTSPAWLDPSQKQAAIVNGNFTKTGAIDKRRGMRKIGNTVLPGNLITDAFDTPARVASTKRSGLLAFSNDALYNYSSEEDALAGISAMPNVGVARQGVPGFFDSASPLLCDFGGSLRMAVYMDQPTSTPVTSITIYATIYDRVSGAIVLQPSVISQTTVSSAFYMLFGCFLFNNGQSIAILGCETRSTTPNEYFLVVYDIASNTFGALQGFGGTGVGSFNIDACPFIGDPAGGFLVCGTGAGGGVDLAYHDGTGAQISITAVDATARTGGNLSVYGDFNNLTWVGYIIAPDSTHWQWTLSTFSGGTAFTPNTGPIALETVLKTSVFNPFVGPIVALDATHGWQAFLQSNASNARSCKTGAQLRFDSTGTPTGGVFWPRGLVPIGRPIVNASGDVDLPCYFYLATAGGENNTCYLVRFSDAFVDGGLPIVASANRLCNVDNANAVIYTIGCFPWMSCGATPTPTTAACAIQINDSIETATNVAVEFSYDRSLLYQVAELGDGVHVSAGVPMVFDGTRIFEESFFSFPEGVTEATSAGTLTGAYSYACVWRRTDSNGNTHTSSPFIAPTPITLASQQMTISVPAVMMSYYNNYPGSELWLDVYVTAASGSTYYYHGSTRAIGHGSASFTYVVNAAPTTTNPFLYTTGGVLDGVNPPGARCMCVHNDRIWIVDDTGETIWFTQAFQPGEAVSWNEELTQPLGEGGIFTAIGSLDDKFVMYKSDSIWVMYGDGPAATGAGSDLTAPQKVASDVGAIDWRSLVLFPKGHLFQARAGIFMLGRDLSVTYIGKAVEDTLAAFPTITSAELVPSAQQVRFTCSNGATTTDIVYDYFQDAWTTHVFPELAADIVSATLDASDNAYTFATLDGLLWKERLPDDDHEFLDEAPDASLHFVSTSITKGPVQLQGVQGYQRARRVLFFGERKSDHGFQFDFAVNGDPTPKQTTTYLDSQLSVDQVAIHVGAKLNKQQSITITVTDTAPATLTDNGEGCRFTSLAVELQQIGDRFRQIAPGNNFLITSVTPDSGGASTAVTIRGAGFRFATSVTFDGVAATSFVVVNDTTITCDAPTHAPGVVDVAVIAPAGTRVAAGAFTYASITAPTVTIVSPSDGVSYGGTSITLTGTNFLIGATSVTVGGNACTDVVVSSSTSLTCTTPEGSVGAKDVAATTVHGTGTDPAAFTYLWTPKDANIPLIIWYDPFIAVTHAIDLTSGEDRVSELPDNSGNGDPNRDQVASGSSSPLFMASDPAYGNKPSLTGDGARAMSAVGAFTSGTGTPVSVLAIGAAAAVTSLFGGDGSVFNMLWNDTGQWEMFNGLSLDAPVDPASPAVVLFTDDGTGAPDAAKMYVTAISGAPAATAATLWGDSTTYNLFVGEAGVANLIGSFACLVIANGIFDSMDLANLVTYLNVTRAYGLGVT